jgi:GNAT superfamily N-acetyltransferase
VRGLTIEQSSVECQSTSSGGRASNFQPPAKPVRFMHPHFNRKKMLTNHNDTTILFKIAATVEDFSEGKSLFQQYAKSLDFDLSFQGFSDELENINKQYNKPTGALILATDRGMAIGCTGIRALSDETAELKRMFVLPGYRGSKVGHKMLTFAIHTSKELGYKSIRLDTLPGMAAAIKLYMEFGFENILPYRFNPFPEAVFMEKKLT